MCCKVYRIDELVKPAGKWCANCEVGSGCRIYEARPDQCRAFECIWLTDPDMPVNWKPETAKVVFSVFPQNGFIYGQVDPASPMAWRKQPILSGLMHWSGNLLEARRHLLIFVQDHATLIMPTGPVDIGPMKQGDGFIVRETFTARGKDYIAERVAR